jgi:ADP-ribosylglycohydrolase
VCAALTARDLRDGLLLAVNHSGDSDSTGSLCGNLLGTVHGANALPPPWYAELELGELVVTTALAVLDRGW